MHRLPTWRCPFGFIGTEQTKVCKTIPELVVFFPSKWTTFVYSKYRSTTAVFSLYQMTNDGMIMDFSTLPFIPKLITSDNDFLGTSLRFLTVIGCVVQAPTYTGYKWDRLVDY